MGGTGDVELWEPADLGGVLNRVVGTGFEDPEQLLAHPDNARIHPRNQRAALDGNLHDLGWLIPVIVNRRTGHVLDGHLRADLAIQLGLRAVPVSYVDIPEDLEAQALATIDPISAQAVTDKAKFDALRERIHNASPHVTGMLDDLRMSLSRMKQEHDATLPQEPSSGDGEGDDTGESPRSRADRLAEAEGVLATMADQWGVEPGQRWRIVSPSGRAHLIVCGDSLDQTTVNAVLDGIRADAIITDPPYNVGYTYAGNDAAGDSREEEAWVEFIRTWNSRWMAKSDRLLLTPGNANLFAYFEAIGKPHEICIWRKVNSMSPGHVTKLSCYEPILFYGPWKQTLRGSDIFDFPLVMGLGEDKALRALHSCPKPDNLFDELLNVFTEPGQVIAEPFCGSGTTLFACERTGRVCRAAEKHPGYVAVILERAMRFGLSPERLS